ncbi:E3 ubiquitin-protein ligase TRIM71 [Geodia barretti]|uniref:E3 ubiquitin-protein ligase TRIM71 n=1 Tax=Geodia barretti TaxID=519541 RepID=A0AA35TX80_GEOBA|nr:E3 ubiquitin-protein ligase TRIM71 [Geodia barretti]
MDCCPNHPEKEILFYCDPCNQLICSYCLVSEHRAHQYDLLANSFAKHEKVIVDSLKPVEDGCGGRDRTAMAHLRQALEARETELVGQAEQTAQQKLKTLAAQRDGFELQLSKLRNCQEYVEESRHTCSQGDFLRMKGPLVKQIDDLTGSFKPTKLLLADTADMKFAHRLPGLVRTCQVFGKVYCSQVCPEKCRASGEGIKVAMRGQTVVFSVEALDRAEEACLVPVDSFTCELVASDGSSRVRGTVKKRNQNIYDISYQPQVTGEHQLHILIEDCPILNSRFTVRVLPNFTCPAKIIPSLDRPWGIAVREEGEMVVVERSGHCLSIISSGGEKLSSIGNNGSGPGHFKNPKGVAIDTGGTILVADYSNHRIQQLSSTGKHLIRKVGREGDGPLQFKGAAGVAVNPHTQEVYTLDMNNHRIQILSSDLTYCNEFGRFGSNNGEFIKPYDVSVDKDGNVYVADCENHRIQVFTDDGVYLRQFGKKGKGEGELNMPVSIAVDSNNVVYVGEWENSRVSVFFADGEFIKCFGRSGKGPGEFKDPFGLAVDEKGTLYVCDTNNRRIQIFT